MAARRRSLLKTAKTIKPEKKMIEDDYCRTCLSTEDLVPIFYNKETEQKRSEDLRLVTGLEIRVNDGLSQKICNQCIETIQLALQFRRTSKKTEKALLNMAYGKTKKRLLKPSKVREKKLPKVEIEVDFDDAFDDFQNDLDYLYDEDEDKSKIDKNQQNMQSHSKVPVKRKREIIPNASSYKCNTCDKEFRMKATYKAHIRFHTNYCVCEACGKRCRNNNQLQEHKRARHGLGRIHKCAYCEYSSATKEALTIHERRHTGERPYVCDHCGATFHRRSNLVQHIAIHLPEKNFQCDMCPKRLKSRKFLQIHKHNAHTGKRYGYLCSICEHRFEKPNKVRAHTRRVHGVPDDQQGPILIYNTHHDRTFVVSAEDKLRISYLNAPADCPVLTVAEIS
ncbi:unnamed protein product, partial [Brenthis ino]